MAQRTAGSSLCAMIKKFYHGMQKAVDQFRFKNVEQHLLLGSGGNQNLRPSCESAVPMMAINWDEVNKSFVHTPGASGLITMLSF